MQLASGATLELMVLAADRHYSAGVDLASGALVRTWSAAPPEERLRPYDVVTVVVGEDAESVPDPAEPEAFALAEAPEKVGHLRGRRPERLLRQLLHPKGQPLLGIGSNVVPFWERRGDHPSIAVVEPEGPVTLWRDGQYLACRFLWLDHERELPCLDRDLALEMDYSNRPWMASPRRSRLVVALTPPIDGRCHKVVEAVLPRP